VAPTPKKRLADRKQTAEKTDLFPSWFKQFLDKNSLSIVVGAPMKSKKWWPGMMDPIIIERVIGFPCLETKTKIYFLQLPSPSRICVEPRTAVPEYDYLLDHCKEVVITLTTQVEEWRAITRRWLLRMEDGGLDENGKDNVPIPVLQLLEGVDS